VFIEGANICEGLYQVHPKEGGQMCLFMRENTLAKGILTVALTKWAPFFHSHAEEKTKRLIAKDRHKFVGFGPSSVFMIA
jgi:hypothetical protein